MSDDIAGKPRTSTGVGLFVVEPSPSWLEKLSPQHHTAPAGVTPQVCPIPDARLVNTKALET